jgi:hypothetical protein
MKDVLRWRGLVEAIAAPHGLDSQLILAMIAQESSGRPSAWNPEPHYRWLWDVDADAPFRTLTDAEAVSEKPPADFPHPPGVDRDAEWWGQQASWGLMQVMGAVARERGFRDADLPGLCVPWVGIYYGVLHLVHLRKRFDGDDMLATYNGGPAAKGKNREYVAAVHARLAELEAA